MKIKISVTLSEALLAEVDKLAIAPCTRSAGSSTLNRGHEHQRLIRRCNAREGRPRCFGGTQRGSGT